MNAILEVAGLTKCYGSLEVVKDISFSVGEGETFALIGPNGAGKTTLFKMMTGETPCSAGSVKFRGSGIDAASDYERVRLGIGRTFQVARVFAEMTAFENVVVAIESRERSRTGSSSLWRTLGPLPDLGEEAKGLLAELGLRDSAAQEARFLSHGDKKRLELAMVLALRPSILMLDEPTAGMSPNDRRAAAALIKKISRSTKISVVLTEHDMDVVFDLADKLMVLNYGKIIALGTPQEVRANPLVQEVYLGSHGAGHA